MKFIATSHKQRAYERPPRFTSLLPWLDYSDTDQCLLLNDGRSVGMGFKVKPIACEAKDDKALQAIIRRLTHVLDQAIPQVKDHPWVVQCYVEDQPLDAHQVSLYPSTQSDATHFSSLQADYQKQLAQHINTLSNPQGHFMDATVTGQPFIARQRIVRLVLYRRLAQRSAITRTEAIEQLHTVTQRLTQQLDAIGIIITPLSGEAWHNWLAGWFSPKGHQPAYPTQAGLPHYTFSERLFNACPQSFKKGWIFDGQYQQVMTLKGLAQPPAIGHLSLERQQGGLCYTVLDRLPIGTVLCLTWAVQHADQVKAHLKKIEKSVIGGHAEAHTVRSQLQSADTAMAAGHALYPCVWAVYLKANSQAELHDQQQHIDSWLTTQGFAVIPENDEYYPIDAYLRYLPMNYDYRFDKAYHYRSHYLLSEQIAYCLPIYGRSQGTKHPGIPLWNRGGNPWPWDPLRDKTKNSHLLLLGETGTGKSNLVMLMLLQLLVTHQARIILIEAGGSFDLFGQYLTAQGLSVNAVKLDSQHPVSLNPFAEGIKLLKQAQQTDRDSLGEMVLAAKVMMTGGEAKEQAKFERKDNQLLIDALKLAAQQADKAGRHQFVAADIVNALREIANTLDHTREATKIQRAQDMADSLQYFCSDPVSHAFFNTEGDPWPLADVTLVDMGLFAKSGYEAGRSVAFAGCLQAVMHLAEQNQSSGRAIIVALDENHLFTKIPLLAELQTMIAKMGRKLGLGIWAITQNLRDFADEAHKMLSLMEHFICLALPPDEIDQIEKFRLLTAEQRALLLSAKKAKGQYTEGVLLSPSLSGLFRNIPPAFYLAMAATDPDEKQRRREIMEKYGCTELEAVHRLTQHTYYTTKQKMTEN